MPAKDVTSIIHRVQTSTQKLAEVATTLNTASDQLGAVITQLDAALKRLNLGVPASVMFAGNDDQNTGLFWRRDLAYNKVAGRWGLAITTSSGDLARPDENDYEEWLFNEAPRSYRIDAVEKIPELLEKLVAEAATLTSKTVSTTIQVRPVGDAIVAMVPDNTQRRK
jgi:hypothetical protein